MATQTVEFRAAPGLTLTARLFTPGSDTIVQTASTVTEATNRKGTYAATFVYFIRVADYTQIRLNNRVYFVFSVRFFW